MSGGLIATRTIATGATQRTANDWQAQAQAVDTISQQQAQAAPSPELTQESLNKSARDANTMLVMAFIIALKTQFERTQSQLTMTDDINSELVNVAARSAKDFATLVRRTGDADAVMRQYTARNPDFKNAFDVLLQKYGQATHSPDARTAFYRNLLSYSDRSSGSCNDLKKYGVNIGNPTAGNVGNGGVGAWEFRRNKELWSVFTAGNSVAQILGNYGKQEKAMLGDLPAKMPMGMDVFGNPVVEECTYDQLLKYVQPDAGFYKKNIGDYTMGSDNKKIYSATYINDNGAPIDVSVTEEQAEKLRKQETINLMINGENKEITSWQLKAKRTKNSGEKFDPSPQHAADNQQVLALRNLALTNVISIYDEARQAGGLLAGAEEHGEPKPSFWVIAGRLYQSHGMTSKDLLEGHITQGNLDEKIDDKTAADKLLQQFGVDTRVYNGNDENLRSEMFKRVNLGVMAYYRPDVISSLKDAGEAIGYIPIPFVSSILSAWLEYKSKEQWNQNVSVKIEEEKKMGASTEISNVVQALQSNDLEAAKKEMAIMMAVGVGIDVVMLIVEAAAAFFTGGAALPAVALLRAAVMTGVKASVKAALRTGISKALQAATKELEELALKKGLSAAMKSSIKKATDNGLKSLTKEEMQSLSYDALRGIVTKDILEAAENTGKTLSEKELSEMVKKQLTEHFKSNVMNQLKNALTVKGIAKHFAQSITGIDTRFMTTRTKDGVKAGWTHATKETLADSIQSYKDSWAHLKQGHLLAGVGGVASNPVTTTTLGVGLNMGMAAGIPLISGVGEQGGVGSEQRQFAASMDQNIPNGVVK